MMQFILRNIVQEQQESWLRNRHMCRWILNRVQTNPRNPNLLHSLKAVVFKRFAASCNKLIQVCFSDIEKLVLNCVVSEKSRNQEKGVNLMNNNHSSRDCVPILARIMICQQDFHNYANHLRIKKSSTLIFYISNLNITNLT